MTTMRFVPAVLIGALFLGALLVPAATAHESYTTDDGKFVLILGEQDEPVYTYDFTNLDFIVHDNATGGPVPGVNATVTATLIAPGGEELSMELEPQFGERGRYAFAEGYLLTQPGQYQVRLDGTINGTDVSGEYLLPGPRASFTDVTFPHDDVDDLRELEARIAELEAQIAAMDGNTGGQDNDEASANAPGFAMLPALIALGAVALLAHRRKD